MNHTQTDLGSGKVGPLLFRLALPAITAQLINLMYNMVDRMYIGHIPVIGASALTGVGVCMPAVTAISAFAALVSMGGAPRASIMMGRNDKNQAEKIMGNCFTMLLIVAALLTGVALLWGRSILLGFGASENTIGYAWDYMQIYSLGTVFVQLALGLNAFINAQGYAKMGMLTVLVGAISNIILDPIFIFVFNMGVKGAAWATILSQGISCFWILQFLSSKKSFLRLKVRNMRLETKILWPSILLGISPFIMQFTESVIFICFNTVLLKYGGDTAVGAMTILSSIMSFSLMPLHGLTQGSQPIVSYNYGARNIHRVQKTFQVLLISCICYSTLVWAFSVLTPNLLVSIFTNDEVLSSYAQWALRIYMSASFAFGAQVACQQTFIALGNAKISIFLALLRKVILLIPLIFILPLFLENQPMGVFLSEPIADTLAVCTTCTIFAISFKKLKTSMTASSPNEA